jgi:hypothetical protein
MGLESPQKDSAEMRPNHTTVIMHNDRESIKLLVDIDRLWDVAVNSGPACKKRRLGQSRQTIR